MPERLYAADTVTVKLSILATYVQCPDVEKFPSRIGTPEPMPSDADTKLHIDHLLANSAILFRLITRDSPYICHLMRDV